MSTAPNPAPISKVRLWTGRALSFLPSAMLLMAGGSMAIKEQSMIDNLTKMGYPAGAVSGIGIALLISVILYLIPQTAVVGAASLTGYLGGAVATHVHHGDPAGNIAGPVIFGIIIWSGLILREPRLDILLPWRRT